MKVKFFTGNTMNTSQDAKRFAPSSCSAKKEVNSVIFMDIALAVSFFLCLIINILGILILPVRIILCKLKKRTYIRQPITMSM